MKFTRKAVLFNVITLSAVLCNCCPILGAGFIDFMSMKKQKEKIQNICPCHFVLVF